MDYTFLPRFMADRGLLLGNEFRYLDPKYKGFVRAEILPYDKELGTDSLGMCSGTSKSLRPSGAGT